ncbi:MAG: hypothetical protein RSB55_00855 [Oscillospiraceae bacterium]
MREVSYEGMGQVTVTMKTEGVVLKGDVVKVAASDTVSRCAAGEGFCGVAQTDGRDGCVAVQISGCCQVLCATAPAVGYQKLTADGTNGVKTGTATDREVLVLAVDAGAKCATVKL